MRKITKIGNAIMGILIILVGIYISLLFWKKEEKHIVINQQSHKTLEKENVKSSLRMLKRMQIKITPQYDFCINIPKNISQYFSVLDKICGLHKGNIGKLLVEIDSEKEIKLDEIELEQKNYSSKKERIAKNKFLIYPGIQGKYEESYFGKLSIFGNKYSFDYNDLFINIGDIINFEKIDNNKYKITIQYGRGEYSYIFDKKGNIETDYGVITRKGFYTDLKYICGYDPNGYIILNSNNDHFGKNEIKDVVKMKDFTFTGYGKCGELKTISKKEFHTLGGKKEILLTPHFLRKVSNIEVFQNLCFSKTNNYKDTSDYNFSQLFGKGNKIKYFYNTSYRKYGFLVYGKNNKLLRLTHCDGMAGSAVNIYNTYINGKIVGYEEKLENEYSSQNFTLKEKIEFLGRYPKLKKQKISKIIKEGVEMYVVKGNKNIKYNFDFVPGKGIKIYGTNLDKNIIKIGVQPFINYETNSQYFPKIEKHNSKNIYISDTELHNLTGYKIGNSKFVYNGFYQYNVFSPEGGGAFKIFFTDDKGNTFEDIIAIKSYDEKYITKN